MNNILRIFLLLLAMFLLGPGSVAAKEISLENNGLTLNAELKLAAGKTLKDGVILMTHGTLAHNKMEIISTLQDLFTDNGFNTLAINLGLGVSDRHGMYDCKTPHTHLHTDAVDEINLWVEWLKQQGVDSIVLLGHSRGGNQTAWYAAEQDNALIKKIILIAPQTTSYAETAADYKKKYGKDIADLLEQAKALVAAGKGKTELKPVDFIYCQDTAATAAAIVSYYQDEPRMDTPYLLQKITRPVLIVAGSEDKLTTDALVKKLQGNAGKDNIRLITIDGADHFFRDLYAEELVDAAVEFLDN